MQRSIPDSSATAQYITEIGCSPFLMMQSLSKMVRVGVGIKTPPITLRGGPALWRVNLKLISDVMGSHHDVHLATLSADTARKSTSCHLKFIHYGCYCTLKVTKSHFSLFPVHIKLPFVKCTSSDCSMFVYCDCENCHMLNR